jgi:hypothetical protein
MGLFLRERERGGGVEGSWGHFDPQCGTTGVGQHDERALPLHTVRCFCWGCCCVCVWVWWWWEGERAPGAIMIRSVAPQELGSTSSALYLCIR